MNEIIEAIDNDELMIFIYAKKNNDENILRYNRTSKKNSKKNIQ